MAPPYKKKKTKTKQKNDTYKEKYFGRQVLINPHKLQKYKFIGAGFISL